MRVGDPPARIYGVKIKLQEQQRRDELYRQSRYPRAKTCHSPFKQRSAWQVAKQCKFLKKKKTYHRPIPNTQSLPGGAAAWGRISKGRGIVTG